MKQKITIKMEMDSDKRRNKALKVAAEVQGVSSVSIGGDDKDRLVVIGENVDTVCLGRLLKKKFCGVTILTVEEVKPEEKDPKKDKKPVCSCKLCIVVGDPCSKCQSPKCRGQCDLRLTWRCYGQCPPWQQCPTCSIGRQRPCLHCASPCDNYRGACDPQPDSCTIV